MTGTDGSAALSEAVQAMPFIPGSWMSIRTTSGGEDGITRNASSAVAQRHVQRNPGAPSI